MVWDFPDWFLIGTLINYFTQRGCGWSDPYLHAQTSVSTLNLPVNIDISGTKSSKF